MRLFGLIAEYIPDQSKLSERNLTVAVGNNDVEIDVDEMMMEQIIIPLSLRVQPPHNLPTYLSLFAQQRLSWTNSRDF